MMDAREFSNLDGVVAAVRSAAHHLVPPPELLPSEFAERNIVIPVGNAVPGPIRFEAAAYQRGMIDVIKEPGIHRVSFMLGAQLGKTTIQQCITAYFVAHEPRSQIWLMPSQGDMLTFRATKLQPMLDANKGIRSLLAKPRGREGQNNASMISFIGGWLLFAWAGSAKTLRGRSAPVTLADEIDGMENAGSAEKDEGDPVQLLMQRAASFGDQRLHIEASTPTVKGFSRIEAAHDQGDQRKFWIPCPHCGTSQVLKWSNVTWVGRQDSADADQEFTEHQPETAGYICDGCGVVWNDGDRVAAVRRGEWIASKPTKGHASFHLSELYSPFRRLRDIVQSYLDKLAAGSLNTFVNVSLAETWENQGERVEPDGLMQRRADYGDTLPDWVQYITLGSDMQTDRLEYEIVGWGAGEESISLAYGVLWGDPLAGVVFDDLEGVIRNTTFKRSDGSAMGIAASCLDTGGTTGYPQAAWEWLRGKTGRRIFGVKGYSPSWGAPIVTAPQRRKSGKKARKVDIFQVAVDEAKLVVMRRIAHTIGSPQAGGPGYMHVPADREEEWFKQITSERIVTKTQSNGVQRREWWKPHKARNEALDCRVYSYAALKIMAPRLRPLPPADPAPEIPHLEPTPAKPETAPVPQPAPAQVIRTGRRKWRPQ